MDYSVVKREDVEVKPFIKKEEHAKSDVSFLSPQNDELPPGVPAAQEHRKLSPLTEIESDDEDRPAQHRSRGGSNGSENPRPLKRRRLIYAVVVPFLSPAERLKYRSQDIKVPKVLKDEKTFKGKGKGKAKKEQMGLPPEFLRARIDAIPQYHVDLDNETKWVFVTRRFMSHVYGGSPQDTIPHISEKRTHGLRDFIYPMISVNPHAPTIPGAGGLFYSTGGRAGEWKQIQRVLIGIARNQWLYVGQYKFTPGPSLTVEEWNMFSPPLKLALAQEILRHGWGEYTRTNIVLWRQLGRRPTKEEIAKRMDSDVKLEDVSTDEIIHAFDLGRETISVWNMQCVDYDVDFQKKLARDFPNWVPPPPKGSKEKAGKKEKTGKKEKGVPVKKQKRKRDMSSDEEDDYDGGGDNDEQPEPRGDPRYRNRGTKSRPIAVS